MYETRARQKAITDARHMLEVQRRIDLEYQASLRRKELEREQTEKNREQHIHKQQRRWLPLSSIYSTRSYERPWASGMITNRPASAVGESQGRWNADSKPLGKKRLPKLPSIASFTDKKKCNPTSVLNKIENGGLSFNIVNPAAEPQIFSKRKRLHQRDLPMRAGLQSMLESQAINGQAITAPPKTTGAAVTGDGRVQTKNRYTDKRSAHGSKSSSHFFQLKRQTKTSVVGGRGSFLQAHHSPAPSSPSTSPREAQGYSLIQNRRPSFASSDSSGASGFSLNQSSGPLHAPLISPGASGSSLHQLSEPSNAPPMSSRSNGSSLCQLSRPSHAPQTSSGANGSSFSELGRPSPAPPSPTGANGSSLSQFGRPSHAPPSPTGANGSSLSKLGRPSHAPPSPMGANGTSLSQLGKPSYAPLSLMPSRASPFRFHEEDCYHLQNTVIKHEDTKDDHLLGEDYLPVGAQKHHTILNENGSFSLISSQQITTSDPGEECQDVGNASLRRVDLPSGSSAQLSVVRTSEEPRNQFSSDENAPVSHEGRRSLCSRRNDDLESNHNVVSPAETLGRFNCAEGTRAGIHRNQRTQVNENSPRLNSDIVSSTGSTHHSQVPHSLSSSARLSMPSRQRPVSTLTRNIDTNSLEDVDMNASPRINASRRPLSPIRSRYSFTTIGNHHPLLDVSATPERDSRGLGSSRGLSFLSQSPTAGQHVHEEHSPCHAAGSSEASYLQSVQENATHSRSARGSLQESLPYALPAMSDLHQQIGEMPRMPHLPAATVKETTKPKADPEKLKRLKESLLEEDTEEEGDLCRICLIPGSTADNPLLEPCQCVGSLQFVHKECLNKWLKAKITSGAELEAVKTCELCRQSLNYNLGDFNMEDYYITHQQFQGQSEVMNSRLYLMLLLHLYEQRYAELLQLTHSRARRDLLFRNYQQLRAEENESSESGDCGDDGGRPSPSSIA